MSISILDKNECANNIGKPAGVFISRDEALIRYDQRLNKANKLDAFLVDIDAMREFIKAADNYSQSHEDNPISHIRIWKGRRRWKVKCSSEVEEPHFLEDLMFMPVLRNKESDLYAEPDSEHVLFDVNYPDLNQKVNLILASCRPCPKWCTVEIFPSPPTYFHERDSGRSIAHSPNDPYRGVNPYAAVCGENCP